MSQDTLTSLPEVDWKARMRAFLIDCAASAPAEQADRIREAVPLLQQACVLHADCPEPEVDAERLDAMLDAGAYESAVLVLIGRETAFMLSRGGSGSCLASAVRPDGAEETIAEGATLALALLSAHAAALLEDAEQACGVLDEVAAVRLN